jgi:predicted nucleotidyltransferase
MESVFRSRKALRARALALAEAATEALPGTVFFVGTFAWGDFSEDSDVDLLVVAEFSGPWRGATPSQGTLRWALCLGTALGSRRDLWSSPGVVNKFLSGARGDSVDALVLPSRVAKLLRRAAEEDGVSLGNFLMDMATARLDPPERAKAYAEAVLELLREAEAELAKGDLRQASEKIWGAAAFAVKAFAYWRDGVRLPTASCGGTWRRSQRRWGNGYTTRGPTPTPCM